MPYKSASQRRAFHAREKRGEIAASIVAEYDRKSKGLRLPERVAKKKTGAKLPAFLKAKMTGRKRKKKA